MQNVKLNLIPGSVLPVVNVSQYDAHRQFSLSVYEGATAYDLTGKTVEIRGTKPDGNGFAYDATDGVVSVSGNTVTISTKEQMTAVGGQTMAELRITSGTTILGTLNFVLDVEPSALSDDTPISRTEIPVIERQLEDIIDEIEVYSGDAEAWAAGTRDGVPVPASDPAYHNNSKYYKDEASTAATTATTKAGEAATSATNAGNSANTASNAATTATTKAGEASTSATNAGNSATAAAGDSLEAEGFAVGEQNGTPVGPDSPYYQNNAAYYAAQAGQYATGGLIFKGSVAFASIPTTGMVNGDMYNITDDFTTDSRFIEGAGVAVKAGADIAFVAGSVNKWDILALGGGGGADALDDLTDVELTSPAEGDLLQYDATEQKWVNNATIPQKVAGLQKTGCVNVLPNYLISQVISGVTLTVNNDGIITANSSDAIASNVIVNMLVRYNVGAGNKHFLPNGTYKLLGSNNSRVHLAAFITKNGAYTHLAETNSAEGAVFTVDGDDSSSDGAYVGVSIQIDRGDAISNVVIKPMITPDLSATYDDYQPYSMTNRELTEEVIDLSQRGGFDGFSGAGFHNSLYRGKYLGGAVSAEQWAQISAGTFDDLFIGDYWTIPTSITIGGTTTTTNINYRIAAFDYFLKCGDTNTTAHHIVIVPDTNLYSEKMNDSDTTAGGYIGSKMYTTYLSPAKDAIKTVFGTSHILSHRVFLTNAVTDGYASGCAWASSDIELMCEQMVYGNGIFSPVSTGAITPANYRVEKSQLPLFALEPSRIAIRDAWWLRDVISNLAFANVNGSGDSNDGYARYSRGVRPAFCIIG